MVQDKKIKHKQNVKNKIWNYIRRNKRFRVGDIFIIFNISYSNFKAYLKVLEETNYIKFEGKSRKPFTEIQYKLINDTGIFAPKLNGNTLYDPNLKTKIETSIKRKEKIVYPKTLMNILTAIDATELTFEEICLKANCANGGLRKWWNRLIKLGIVEGYINEKLEDKWYERRKKKDDKLIYRFNVENAKRVKEELLKGAYTRGEPEMKHLWIH
jgi:predicted transcriptional regulator